MHRCRVCGEEKSLDQFVKHLRSGPLQPWNLRRCKECTHAQYIKRRDTDPASIQSKNEKSREWKKMNPERHASLAREYRLRHPEKITAQNRLNYAISKGRLQRQPCAVCGTSENVHGHHISYRPEDWYNVRWLCHVCHAIEHVTDESEQLRTFHT